MSDGCDLELGSLYQGGGYVISVFKSMDERYKFFRQQYLDRQAELQAMFARAMSGKTSTWEVVGEPVTHNIKF